MPSYTVIDLTTLSTSAGYAISGTTAGGRAGTWVSNAGDINGDGIADLLIGAPGTGSGAAGAGRVYVIFGTNGPPRTSIDLATLSPSDGFTIIGQPNDSGNGDPGSGTGINVSNAGDVNGDGIADLIIGADRADTGNGNNGAAYVIYGRAGGTRADISLGALSPTDGFAIVGGFGTGNLDNSGSARLGFSVSGAGDVNGDGLADVIVGAPMAIGNSPDGNNPVGQAFVIFGRAGATRATINVDALAATDGFSISGSQSNPFAGASVSGAGDFNHDGFADVIVGASRIDVVASAGVAAYVIFGQAGASRGNVALDNPASYAGARIQVNVGEISNGTSTSGNRIEVLLQNGGATNGLLTYYDPATIDPIWIVSTRVSSAGDVNGDGFADLVIGIPENQTNFSGATGARPTGSFIVYGRAGADLADFSVIGSANGSNQLFGGTGDVSQLGYSVSQAGDINADGIDDFIVGRPGPSVQVSIGGFTYVVFGRAGGIGDLALTDTLFTGPLTSDRGLTLVVDGLRAGDRAGTSVSAAGDVNNDGIADLIVGAPLSDDGGTNAGRSYVVYGNMDYGAILGTAGGETLTGTAGVDIINAKGGNDILDGGAGGDLLRGGAGDDLYRVDDAGDRVVELLGEGMDTVEANFSYILPANIENLTYTGTGAATLTGNAGNNVLDTGTSATGLVTLIGGDGDDTLILRAGSFAVGIVGGAGVDTLRIERDLAIIPVDIENIVYIGTGNATLIGNAGANVITGGVGDDIINGGGGADTMTGGTGNDVYTVDNVGDVVTELAGEGTDEVRTTLTSYTTPVNVEKVTLLGAAGGAMQTVTGSTGTDSFDFSQRGASRVTANGGGGEDAFFFGATFSAADTVDGGAGNNDQIGLQGDYTGANRLVLGATTLSNVELLAALPGFSYDITTNDANVAAGQVLSIFGGNLGVGESFTFNGAAETDGSFRVYGGLGTDSFTGGARDDGFYFGPGKWGAGDTVTGGAGTNDQLALDGNYTVSISTNADVETLVLLPGPIGSTNSFDITLTDVWTAASQTKTVWGAQVTTAMTIDGSAESDGRLVFFGGQGADILTGGAGADAIFGGGGGDALRGGAGANVFRYDSLTDSFGTTNATRDRILDFTTGDRIDLSRIDAITGGGDDAFSFIGDAAFGNIAGQLRATDLGGGVFNIEGDVNGDGIADFALLVTAGPGYVFTGTDFVL